MYSLLKIERILVAAVADPSLYCLGTHAFVSNWRNKAKVHFTPLQTIYAIVKSRYLDCFTLTQCRQQPFQRISGDSTGRPLTFRSFAYTENNNFGEEAKFNMAPINLITCS